MRKRELSVQIENTIMILDDDTELLDALFMLLTRNGYRVLTEHDPVHAICRLKEESVDLLVLDYLMMPLNGNKVVQEVRKFDKELYILMLTGHKDLVNPLKTIKEMDIQAYCEKGDHFDQLLLMIESGMKSVNQMRTIIRLNEELNDNYLELRNRYFEIVETLRLVVESKDNYTKGHSDRTAKLSVLLGKELGLAKNQLEVLKIGAIFHDIGKIGTRDEILTKNSGLQNWEYEEIKKHPEKGVRILAAVSMFNDILPIVLYHHERFDGMGYPEGLIGEEIPLLARIVTIADAFEAMTSDREYRRKLDFCEVVEQLEIGSGTQFDPRLCHLFLNMIESDTEVFQSLFEKDKIDI